MSTLTDIATDLVTPLGAYLRLREGARGAFLLESVDRGRLGRYSFVGCGSRLVDLAEAEALGEPVVGYLGYDVASRGSSRRYRSPPTGPVSAGEPSSSCPSSCSASTTSAASPTRSSATRPRRPSCFDAAAGDPGRHRQPRPAAPLPRPGRARAPRRDGRRSTSARATPSRSSSRSGRSGRRRSRPFELYRALRRVNPSPYLFLLELPDGLALVGSSPETHVKAEGSRASLNPIAGTIRPGEGADDELLASEKDRAEHVMLVDLGRNDLSRVCVPGSVHVERFMYLEHYSHVTHLVSEVVGELATEMGPFELLRATFPAGTLSGRAEGAGDADHLGARGVPPRRLRRRGRVRAAGRRHGHVHRDPDGGAPGRRRVPPGRRRYRRRLRPGGRARRVPEQARRPREPRIDLAECGAADDPARRQLRQLHVQPRAPVRGARGGGDGAPQRRDRRRRGGAARAVAPRRLPRPRPAGRRGRVGGDPPAARPRRRRRSASASATRRSSRSSAARSATRASSSTARRARCATTARGLFTGLPDPFEAGRYHSLAATRVPDALVPTAYAEDGEVMAVRHRELPVVGVQFHPESVLTPDGPALARNFLEGRL